MKKVERVQKLVIQMKGLGSQTISGDVEEIGKFSLWKGHLRQDMIENRLL